MQAALPFVALLLAAGCDRQPGAAEQSRMRALDGSSQEIASSRRPKVPEGVAVIDQASVLSAAEKASLERRGSSVAREMGRKLTVVLLRPTEGESLEQVAWAIAPRQGDDEPMLLVVDVATGAVRVDGAGDAAKAAAIAGAMRDEVKSGRVASGLQRGLSRVAALDRQG